MIVRKPYAFLIKYFKIIHMILFLLMTFLMFKARGIYNFFGGYLKNNSYLYYDNMAFHYIKIFDFFIVIFLITLLVLIYFLMKEKKKKRLFYIISIIYYVISFIYYIIIVNFFSSLEFQTYSNQAIVLYRDLSLIMYYSTFVFIAFTFARGFGFDIKKFNFEKDMIELNMSIQDREEVELGKNIDYEAIMNKARRGKRNFMYFIEENSFIFKTLLITIILIFSSSFIINTFIVNRVYSENTKIKLNGYSFVINSSYITNKDKYGKEIKKDYYYLIVDFTVFTDSENAFKLKTEDNRIKIGNKYYYLKDSIANKFDDLGTLYKNQSIKKDMDNNYIFVFEIPKKVSSTIFELYNYQTINAGMLNINYKKFKLKPSSFKSNNLGDYKTNNIVNLEKTYLKNGSLNIKNYEVLDIETYTYQVCKIENDCTEKKKTIVPKGINKLLKIEYEIKDLKNNIFDYLNIRDKSNKNILSSASTIRNVTSDNYYENTILLEVSNNVTNTDSIDLLFDIRNTTFSIVKE